MNVEISFLGVLRSIIVDECKIAIFWEYLSEGGKVEELKSVKMDNRKRVEE